MIRKIIFSLYSIVLLCFTVSCSKDDPFTQNSSSSPSPENIPVQTYYVRYDTEVSSYHVNVKVPAKVTTEKGTTDIIIPGGKASFTYGPFKKGETVSIKGGSVQFTQKYVKVTISTSKNNEPFAIKAEQKKVDISGINLSYTIE